MGTVGALQFYITHEAGESEFMLLEGYTFEIEISGEANPVRCRVRLFVTNDETGAWDCELLGA
ncbi:hypothetical protein WG908_08020 [Sphingobium sp. AN641]|uniref:hypothetical protein n=1 Tax=Sphingobium sp. AN641 TaxID=3133443 RepID=UPI0030BC0568